jgi:hypothetical protein
MESSEDIRQTSKRLIERSRRIQREGQLLRIQAYTLRKEFRMIRERHQRTLSEAFQNDRQSRS